MATCLLVGCSIGSFRSLSARIRVQFTATAAVLVLIFSLPLSARTQDPPDQTSTQPATAPTVPPGNVASHTSSKVNKNRSKHDVNLIGQRGVGDGVNLYSLEREQLLGRELAQQTEMQTKLITDPVITEYINRIGQRIVRNSDAQVPFTIKVIDSDEINAFALPGGFFYVNSGLILATDNEAQLAGLMAHEVAHVAARHATRAQTRMQIWNVLSIPLLYFGGPAGMVVRNVAGLAAPFSFMKFNRDAEREADLLGLEYEYATGYDPQEFVQFFEKLHVREKQKHNLITKAFATHPMTEDRIKRAQKEIAADLPPKNEYIVDSSEFQEVKARLAELMHASRMGQDADRPVLHRRGPEDGNDDNVPVLHRKTDSDATKQ